MRVFGVCVRWRCGGSGSEILEQPFLIMCQLGNRLWSLVTSFNFSSAHRDTELQCCQGHWDQLCLGLGQTPLTKSDLDQESGATTSAAAHL